MNQSELPVFWSSSAHARHGPFSWLIASQLSKARLIPPFFNVETPKFFGSDGEFQIMVYYRYLKKGKRRGRIATKTKK